DPLIGAGYQMYWDVHKKAQGVVTSAHNGYLEIYLDGGTIGVCFLVIMLVGVGIRAMREFLTGSEYGRLTFAFYVGMLLFNISESMYARRSPIWFTFLLFSLEFRGCLPSAAVSEESEVFDDFSVPEPEAVGSGHA